MQCTRSRRLRRVLNHSLLRRPGDCRRYDDLPNRPSQFNIVRQFIAPRMPSVAFRPHWRPLACEHFQIRRMTHPLYQLNEQLRLATVLASRSFVPRTLCRFAKRRPWQVRDQFATASPHWQSTMTLPRTSRTTSTNVTRWVDVRPTFSRDDYVLGIATESSTKTNSRFAPRQQCLWRKTPRFDNLIRFSHHR